MNLDESPGGYPTRTRWSVLHAEGSGATESVRDRAARWFLPRKQDRFFLRALYRGRARADLGFFVRLPEGSFGQPSGASDQLGHRLVRDPEH